MKLFDDKQYKTEFKPVVGVDVRQHWSKQYAASLPGPLESKYSLGEGNTPMTLASNLGKNFSIPQLFIKHEHLNPTGSFKDRESFISVCIAKQRKLSRMSIVSSGNAAVSLAAYAQVAKIDCTCFISKSTSIEKKQIITMYGAKVVEIDGNYESIYRQMAVSIPIEENMTTGICSERPEANKVIAYEIWKKIGAPTKVIVPCGNGGNLYGIWKGFRDLQLAGLLVDVPQMIGVQIMGADPLAQAFAKNKPFVTLTNSIDSIAEGIIAEESYCSPKVMTALKQSGGCIMSVKEEEILPMVKQVLVTESLLIEPTSAAAFCALNHIVVQPTDTVVVISTGSGQKMVSKLVEKYDVSG